MGLTSPIPVGDSGIYLPQTREPALHLLPDPRGRFGWTRALAESTALGGLVPHTESTAMGELEPLAESTVLGGLVPRIEHAALGGLFLTSTAFHDFRTHEHVYRLTAFLLPRGDSSVVFLPPSLLPNAVPDAGRFHLPITSFSLGQDLVQARLVKREYGLE